MFSAAAIVSWPRRSTFVGMPPAGRKNTATAHQMVAFIAKLYAIERELRDSSPEEHQATRERRSRPIVDKINTWLDAKVTQALP